MKKTLIVISITVFALLSSYWIKNLIGVNFFESYSFSQYFPFKYLQQDCTLQPKSRDTIIDESFNTRFFFKRDWSNLWMVEKGKVVRDYDTNGFNNSRCLLIKSNSDKSWVYSSLKYIAVKKGDIFSYAGFINLKGENTYAGFSFISFDENKNVIKWNCETTKKNQHNEVIKIAKQFTVTDEIAFIKFKIFGRGVGEFRFDDIELRKL